jgi:hypothetical protein
LLGLFLVVCLPPAADEECSGYTDDARRKSRCIGVDLGLLPFAPLKKQHVRGAEKKRDTMEKRTRDSRSRERVQWPEMAVF